MVCAGSRRLATASLESTRAPERLPLRESPARGRRGLGLPPAPPPAPSRLLSGPLGRRSARCARGRRGGGRRSSDPASARNPKPPRRRDEGPQAPPPTLFMKGANVSKQSTKKQDSHREGRTRDPHVGRYPLLSRLRRLIVGGKDGAKGESISVLGVGGLKPRSPHAGSAPDQEMLHARGISSLQLFVSCASFLPVCCWCTLNR